MSTIYDEIGGADGVALAVDDFYARVLRDPALRPYFEGVAMRRQTQHLRAFLAAALGGPERYRGRTMDRAHAGLGITEAVFDGTVGHLVATLRALGVRTETIAEIGTRLAPLRPQIVRG